LHEQCRIDCESPHRELAKLKLWRNKFYKIRDHLADLHLSDEFEVAVVLVGAKLVGANKPPLAPGHVLNATARLEDEWKKSAPLRVSSQGNFYSTLLDGGSGPLALFVRLGALKRRETGIGKQFTVIPQVDYIGAKTKLEHLNTQLFADCIDEDS
jgi:hypothetical protein